MWMLRPEGGEAKTMFYDYAVRWLYDVVIFMQWFGKSFRWQYGKFCLFESNIGDFGKTDFENVYGDWTIHDIRQWNEWLWCLIEL